MSSPYSSQAVVNYNANPPADDGSAVAANRVLWSTFKTKIGDPLNTFASTLNAALIAAFGKMIGSAGTFSTAISYSVVSGDQGKLIRGTNSGITITTPDATDVQSPFAFSLVNVSSGAITLDGFSAQTIDGATTISIPAGGGVDVETDGTNWFTHGQNYIGTQVQPQGRLTLTSGAPVMNADVSAAAAVYYTPAIGNLCPIYNGSLFQMRSFAELTLTLQANSNYAASAIYDCFIFDSSGTVTFGIGPAWSTATAGSGARGTGAGTTELQKINGIWTNKVQITARNAGSTYTVAANQGTYVGSIFMDASNGQVSAHVTYGQSRKWGLWNAYNRQPIALKAGDGTASWTYTSATFRPSNNSTANSLTVFAGLPEESFDVEFFQAMSASSTQQVGIGWNSTTTTSGTRGGGGGASSQMVARHVNVPAIGINTVTALESAISASITVAGTEASMLLLAEWRG